MNLGEKIYQLRTQRNLSQGDLADALDVSRQSISKWETNGSVPELDKLVKLSEIFGVSLDELVLDKKPEENREPEPRVVYVEKSPERPPRKTAGTVLLCLAAAVWLVFTILGGLWAGLFLALPFASCGLICLYVRNNVGLWCSWTVYYFVEIYLRFATGVTWKFVFLPQMYTDGWTIQLIVSWCMVVIFSTLTAVTAIRLRKVRQGHLRREIIGTAASCGAYALNWAVMAIFSLEWALDSDNLWTYRVVSSVSGWSSSVILVIAIVFTVRLISALWEKRRKTM